MDLQEKYQDLYKQLHSDVTVEQVKRKYKENRSGRIKSIGMVTLFLCIGVLVGSLATSAAGEKRLIEMLYEFSWVTPEGNATMVVLEDQIPERLFVMNEEKTYVYEMLSIQLEEREHRYILHIEEQEFDVTEVLKEDIAGAVRLLQQEEHRITYEKEGQCYEICLRNHDGKLLCEVKQIEE